MKKFLIIFTWIVFCFFMVRGEDPRKDTIKDKKQEQAQMQQQIQQQIMQLDSILLIKADTTKRN